MAKLFARPVLSAAGLGGVGVGVALMAAIYGGQAPNKVDSVNPAGITPTTSASTAAAGVAMSASSAAPAGTRAPAAAATPGAPAAAVTTTAAPVGAATTAAPVAPGAPGAAAATTTAAPVTTTAFGLMPPTTASATPSMPWCYDKGGKVWRSGAGESCTDKSPDFVEYR